MNNRTIIIKEQNILIKIFKTIQESILIHSCTWSSRQTAWWNILSLWRRRGSLQATAATAAPVLDSTAVVLGRIGRFWNCDLDVFGGNAPNVWYLVSRPPRLSVQRRWGQCLNCQEAIHFMVTCKKIWSTENKLHVCYECASVLHKRIDLVEVRKVMGTRCNRYMIKRHRIQRIFNEQGGN